MHQEPRSPKERLTLSVKNYEIGVKHQKPAHNVEEALIAYHKGYQLAYLEYRHALSYDEQYKQLLVMAIMRLPRAIRHMRINQSN